MYTFLQGKVKELSKVQRKKSSWRKIIRGNNFKTQKGTAGHVLFLCHVKQLRLIRVCLEIWNNTSQNVPMVNIKDEVNVYLQVLTNELCCAKVSA